MIRIATNLANNLETNGTNETEFHELYKLFSELKTPNSELNYPYSCY
jgi:hypothetical protein